MAPMSGIMWPYAKCNHCGWRGSRADLAEGSNPVSEKCPECKFDDTEWLTEEEYNEPD